MPEPSILICAPGLDTEESASSLHLLRQLSLPYAAKYVFSTSKFEGTEGVKVLNVEGTYPAETATLQTLARWAKGDGLADLRFRDGFDLYCFSRALPRKMTDYAVLLRGQTRNFEDHWSDLKASVDERPFVTFGEDNDGGRTSLVVNLRDERTPHLLDAAMQLWLTGAVYGMPDYSLDGALGLALSSVDLERSLARDNAAAAEAASPTLETALDDGDEDLSQGQAG